jgi:hypothetical protein
MQLNKQGQQLLSKILPSVVSHIGMDVVKEWVFII